MSSEAQYGQVRQGTARIKETMTRPTQCDICGSSVYALQLFSNEGEDFQMTRFRLPSASRDAYGCTACIMKLEAAQIAKDWTLLPPGPMRKAFEKEDERRKLATKEADHATNNEG